MIRLPDGLVIFNPGSVGCPAYDDPTEPAHVSEQGSPHARYGIVELGEDGAPDRFEAIAVSYDHEAAAVRAEQVRPAGMGARAAHRLHTALRRRLQSPSPRCSVPWPLVTCQTARCMAAQTPASSSFWIG